MSQKSMRRHLRKDKETTSEDALQVGDFQYEFDDNQPIVYLAYDNGCKKIWSNDDPKENPDSYRWDCPEGVDPPVDTDGYWDDEEGDRGLDDDYANGGVDDDANDDANGDDEDYGDTLVYECTQKQLCNQSSPSDPGAEGWEFQGVCDFGADICPFPTYDASKTYSRGDKVSVEVEKLLHLCINSEQCNDNVPTSFGANVNGEGDGWKLLGGSKAGENSNVEEFDASKATSDNYTVGDEVFTTIGRSYGTIGSMTGGSGGAGGFGGAGGNGEGGTGGTGGSGGGGGFGGNSGGTGGSNGSATFGAGAGTSAGAFGVGENGDSFKLIYQCSDKEKCNNSRPSGPSAVGWDLVGTCSGTKDCAPQFTDSDEYNVGDKTSVSVDKLVHGCVDESNCNDHVPGGEGWELIGGCRTGRICNAVEFDTSKAANGEYVEGDEVFTRIGYDYGTIGSTGRSETNGSTGGSGTNISTGGSGTNGSTGGSGTNGSTGGSDTIGTEGSGTNGTGESGTNGTGGLDAVGENEVGGENGDTIDSVICPASQEEADKTLVTYAYQVETALVTDASTILPSLEGEILKYLANSMLSWCLTDERLRRRLADFGVSGVESFPADVAVPGGLCTYESSTADGCFAMDGGLTLSFTGVSSDAAADATRALLKEAMSSDALLNPDVPEVVKVKYLGASYDDYVQDFPEGGTGLPGNSASGKDMQGRSNGIPIAIGAVTLLALLLLALCCVKRRMNKDSKDDFNTLGDDSDLDDELDDVIDRIGGIGNQPTTFAEDPPGSFHMGNSHYTVDGLSYKSLSCAQCQADKAPGFIGCMIATKEEEKDLDLNDKNDLSFDLDLATNFIDFSRKDLGRTHTSMNVRHCKSSTCEICKKTGGIVFIKSQNEEREIEL